ncbi:MAG: YkgJ family cysteine cluster protein, partial [Nonlabens ulvanivorans]
MEDFLKSLPQLAAQKKKENQAYFKKLKKKAPKNLDNRMQELHDETFEEVDCLSCANCCKTTGPLFTHKDIDRIAKHFRMKPSDFIDQFLRIDEDKDYVL